MAIYRTIYRKHYGSIPKDSNGRSYEIHHIDGNHANNDIKNLKAVTIQEHYDIHWKQQDYSACARIAARMEIPPETQSHLISLAVKERVRNRTHPFIGGKVQRLTNARRIADGTHHLLSGEQQKIVQNNLIARGEHNFQKRSYEDRCKTSKSHVAKQIKSGKHNSQILYKCPHCNITGKSVVMKRWHFERCKHLNPLII